MLQDIDVNTWLGLDGGTDAPRVLMALRLLWATDAEERQQALSTLGATIHRDGEPTGLSARVVPLLIELLADATVVDRHTIVALLLALAVGGADGPLAAAPLAGLAELPSPPQQDDGAAVTAELRRAWTLAALRDGTPALLVRLADGDARVRAAVAQLLGLVGCPAAAACEALLARIGSEEDANALASALIALGLRAAPAAVDDRVSAVLLAHAHQASASMLVRLSGIVGLAFACPALVSKVDQGTLEQAEYWPRLAAAVWPWYGGDIGRLAVTAADHLREAQVALRTARARA